MRRVVQLDPQTFFAMEIDTSRLAREAKELMRCISRIPAEMDADGYYRKLVPLCEAAIAGSLPLPLDVDRTPLNLAHLRDIGTELDAEFVELYARFMNTATGSRIEGPPFKKDGKTWAWMEFE
jgi:hypothetical protein